MKDKFLRQARREYSPRQRILALLVEAIFFLGAFPAALVVLGALVDRWLRWPQLPFGYFNLVVGGILTIGGWLIGLWANYAQFTLGRGTPVPLMATQRLIIQPPYNYCRNPMTLGAILMYLGVAVVFGSIGAGILVILGAAALLIYIKVFEEKEMIARFGQEYLEYRRNTPFLLPRLSNR